MSLGTLGQARQSGAARKGSRRPWRIRRDGGSTFAERPELEAPDARIIWHAELDPGTLELVALPAETDHPDAVDPGTLQPWLTMVADHAGEHAVLSDGWHHIRIDVAAGSLAAGQPVILEYHLHGVASAEPKTCRSGACSISTAIAASRCRSTRPIAGSIAGSWHCASMTR